MKYLVKILRYISIVLTFLSVGIILISFFSLEPDSSISFIESVYNIYCALAKYAGLYKFTLIVCAFFVALRQLEISKHKQKREVDNDTLKQCTFYLTEFQDLYSKLMLQFKFGVPVTWPKLSAFTRDSLETNYNGAYGVLDEMSNENARTLILTFSQLEAFSALLIHGNHNMQLAKDIIGETFIGNVGALLGLISYFRIDTTSTFCQNTIKLYTDWKKIGLKAL